MQTAESKPEKGNQPFVSFRTDQATRDEIKIAAIKARMTLGEYLIAAHKALSEK